MTRLVAVVLVLSGCSLDSSALLADASFDAPVRDTGVTDGADARMPDSGPRDSRTPDVTPPRDAGCNPADCALGCSPTADRCAELVPSNVAASFMDPLAPDILWDVAVPIDTDDCAFGTRVMQSGGGEVCAVSVGTLTITGALDVLGSIPLVIVAYGAVDISGDLDLSADGTVPGPGGGSGGTELVATGSGPSPGTRGTNEETYGDGGGSGGGNCGAGGNGGNGGSGSVGGMAGPAIDPGQLAPLVGGSGGGLGYGTNAMYADGGGGGGAVQITSRVSISMSGRVRAAGGGGRGGGSFTTGNWGAGGGGGSGGSVLLEAPTIEAPGVGKVVTSGGGGGAAGHNGGDGGDGNDGVNAVGRAAGGASRGGGAGAGGSSGGGTNLDARPGGSNALFDGSNGGGGGGGAGCILLRTLDGAVPESLTDSSPRVGDGLRALPLRLR